MRRSRFISNMSVQTMRATVLITLLALAVAAQWALDPSVGYRGWTVDAAPSLPVSFSASVQLLPTPYWQEWVLGNWTTAFVAGRGCTVQGGPLRYGILVSRSAYVETPAVKLGQDFTVVAVVKPRYSASDTGWIWLWYKGGSAWFGEISATVEGWGSLLGTFFRVADASSSEKYLGYGASRGFAVLAFVGMYVSSQNTYYMYIYKDGALVAQNSFTSQRGDISTFAFRLGSGGGGADQPLWYVAFAVYNRSLTAAEVAGWRPEAPAGGGLVMYYYAHPQFVKDVDGDGVLEWVDLSGNNRHAKLRGAAPQWFAEPVALQTQQCGGVSLTAQWDGFTATYAINGTQRSTFEPGRVHFDGVTSYAVVPISFYGWQGLTIEAYVYVQPCQPTMAFNMGFSYGAFGNDVAYIILTIYSGNGYCRLYSYVEHTYKRPDGSFRTVVSRVVPPGKWNHVVVTFNKATMVTRIYINGTLASEGTWDYEKTILDYPYSGFYIASAPYGLGKSAVDIAYVRIYSRELSPSEIQQNYQNPNTPVANGLEVWLSWDSFRGGTWLDKSGKGRHATVYGNAYSYPHWQWTVGAYLQHGYPAASPLVVTDLKFSGAPWTSGVSRGGAVPLVRVDGAYVDAAAYAGTGWAVSRYVAPNAAFGFDAVWTPSDDYRGWITLWSVGGNALNITQVGGHGVSVGSASARGYAGTVVAVQGDGLYVNYTKRASLPTGAEQTSFALLPTAQGGLRALVRYAWLDAGVRYGANSSATYGGYGGSTYAPPPAPSPWTYFVDFRWWPPVATWGILQNPPFTAVRQRPPNQPLVPATLSAAYATNQSAWGPFGEVCVGSAGGQRYVFGVRHVWLSNDSATCILPLSSAPSTASPTFYGYGRLPPVLPWQHPLLVNSVPRSEQWLVDYSAPYVDASSPVRIPYAARACTGSFCVQGGYAAAYSVYFSQPGMALNKTGYVYVFGRSGVSIIDSVAYVAPLKGYAVVLARDAHLPGVTVATGGSYYSAWVAYEPKYGIYFPADGSYVEVGNVPMDKFTIVMVVAKPDRDRGAGSEYLWRGLAVSGRVYYDVYATLNNDDSTSLCINSGEYCVSAAGAFSDSFNVVAYVVDSGNLAVYVNGRLAASDSFTRLVDRYILRFGERRSGTPYPFYVHAAYVYTRPLTAVEVQAFNLYSPPRSGLAAWYLAEPQFYGLGKWFDASGNGRHAASVGNLRIVPVTWPRGSADTNQPAQAFMGPLSGPPTSAVAQLIAAVYVETDGDVVVSTWVPAGGDFDYKTGGYGRGTVPVFGYMGNMIVAAAKVDLAVYGRYAFLVRRDNVHVYSFATELSGSRLDVPIKVPYPGYYTVDVFYNGTRIRSGVYWLDQGGAVYLGTLGPPLSLVPIQPVPPATATPIYTSPMQPLEWLPKSLPLPAAVSSNPIEVSAAAALAVALAAAYVTYSSSRRLELGLAAAIAAFFATVSLLLPAGYRGMVGGWAAFLVTSAMLLIVYYMTR